MLLSRPCRITRVWSTGGGQGGNETGLGQPGTHQSLGQTFLSSQAILFLEARRLGALWAGVGGWRIRMGSGVEISEVGGWWVSRAGRLQWERQRLSGRGRPRCVGEEVDPPWAGSSDPMRWREVGWGKETLRGEWTLPGKGQGGRQPGGSMLTRENVLVTVLALVLWPLAFQPLMQVLYLLLLKTLRGERGISSATPWRAIRARGDKMAQTSVWGRERGDGV